VGVVRIDSALDVRPAHEFTQYKDGPLTVNNEHHLSHLRVLLEGETNKRISRLCVLGLQGHRVTKRETELLEALMPGRHQLVYLERDIKKSGL